MQLRPFHLNTLGPGLIRDILCKFLAKHNFAESIPNHFELLFMETWLIPIHFPTQESENTYAPDVQQTCQPRPSKQRFPIISFAFLKRRFVVQQVVAKSIHSSKYIGWSLIDMLLYCHHWSQHVSHFYQTFADFFFSEFQVRKTFLRCPKLETGFRTHASRIWGPGPARFVASTAAPLDSRSSAASTLPQ